MDKHAAAHVLESIASYLELKGANPFKVRAFSTAAHAVASYAGDLDEALASGALAEVKGIGRATLDVVREAASTGRSSALEALQREIPPGLVEMLRISGLGVTKIRALHQQLGIATLAQLEEAARDGRLARLPRFGDRTAQKILSGIAFLRRASGYRLSHHAAQTAERLRQALAGLPGIERVEIAGSVRRHAEIVRDVDLVALTRDTPAAFGERLAALGVVQERSSAADAPFTLRLDEGTLADVFCVGAKQFGAAWLRATGSAAHLERLAARAKERGLGWDPAAGGPVGAGAAATEETLYASLGLAWIPPELREGGDEIARAAAGTLPRLVERGDIAGLLHCHSAYSDGTNTVAELADACRAEGYRYLGITDHSVAAAYAGGMREDAIARQHQEIDELNRRSDGFRVLKGIEADILSDGALDYTSAVLDRFDFVIGSVHSRMEQDERTMTERVLKAMDDPHLTILGHPTGRLLLARDPFPIDLDAVIARAAERGVAIEINADPHRLDLDWRRCAQAKRAGVAIAIGADAHDLAALGYTAIGVGIARKGGLEADDILNARDAEGFLAHARHRQTRH